MLIAALDLLPDSDNSKPCLSNVCRHKHSFSPLGTQCRSTSGDGNSAVTLCLNKDHKRTYLFKAEDLKRLKTNFIESQVKPCIRFLVIGFRSQMLKTECISQSVKCEQIGR